MNVDKIKQLLFEFGGLYDVVSKKVLDFLEPCLDYDVPRCHHKIAFCECGNTFDFRESILTPEKFIVEKFCPFCGVINKHNTLRQEGPFSIPVLVRAKTFLKCVRCSKHAESYDHKYCSACQHILEWF